jgi:predicted Zn-dependent peptidase
MLDRQTAPGFREIDHITLIHPVHIKLDNGCNIFCFNSGDQELVRIEWVFNNLKFNPAKPLLNVAANTMLTEGTSRMTAAQIADKVDFYGAFLQAEYGFDHSEITLYSLNKHLSSTLPVLKDILTDSVYPEKELETYVRNQQQKLQVSLQKNDIVARRAYNKAIYGDTIYGYAGTAEDYKQLNREDLLAHYKEMYQPANCTIIISGKIEPQTIDLVKEYFDKNWQNNNVKTNTTLLDPQPATEHFYYTEKPEALQSAIRMGMPMVNRLHPDFPALQVLNTVLGGYFGSRLMANIREDKGYTYGIGSGLSSMKNGAAFYIATEVGADVCRSAVEEIEKEINILKSELIPAEELDLVRNFMLGSLLGSLENVFSHADKFKMLYFAGLDYSYYDRYTATVKSITADELLVLANKYLKFDEFYKVIVGKFNPGS